MLVLHDEMVVCVVVAVQSVLFVTYPMLDEAWVTPKEPCKAPHQQDEYQIEYRTIEQLWPVQVLVVHEEYLPTSHDIL